MYLSSLPRRIIIATATRNTIPQNQRMTMSTTIQAAQAFVDNFNTSYAEKHELFENQFWGTKMALTSKEGTPNEYSTALLSSTKKDMEDLLSDISILNEAKEHRDAIASEEHNEHVLKVLNVIIRTCQCNEFPTPEAKTIREETNKLEGNLEKKRNEMSLGYKDTNGVFQSASSVGLRTSMRTSTEESVRKSAYEGLRSIGGFVCNNGFLEIVKLRNQLGKMLGYEDYYDYTVTNSEGFDKKTLFEILDGLEEGTRPLMIKARKVLEEKHGKMALNPWNTGYMMAGSVTKKMVSFMSNFINNTMGVVF